MKSSARCAHYVKYDGHNEGETSKDHSVNLPSVHPPDKSKSRSPLLDDPATPRRVAPARMSKFPTASRRTPRRHPCTCTFPAKKQTRPRISRECLSLARSFRRSPLFRHFVYFTVPIENRCLVFLLWRDSFYHYIRRFDIRFEQVGKKHWEQESSLVTET